MAHIILRVPGPDGDLGQLIINGVDVSQDVMRDFELVRCGEEPYAEVGFRVTYALASLEINGEDTVVTDQFEKIEHQIAQLVTSDTEAS